MSGAQPQPRAQQEADAQSEAQPQPHAQPQPQPQPHRPPQAYPAPPVSPPPANPPTVGGAAGGGQATGSTAGHGYGYGQGTGSGAGTAPNGADTSGTDAGAGVHSGGAVRRPRTGARTVPRTRKARLRVAKADPWSVMKVSFLLSIALGVCTVVAVAVLWMVMNAMGVFTAISGTVSQATESGDGGFDLESFLSLPRVLLFTGVIAAIDVVLATALATLGAFIYNLSAGFVGGVEVTLAEDE